MLREKNNRRKKRIFFLLCTFLLPSCSFPSCAQVDLDAQRQHIEELIGFNKFDEALLKYRRLVTEVKEPQTRVVLLLELAAIAESRLRYAEALSAYHEVLSLAPLSEVGRFARERRAEIFEIREEVDAFLEEMTGLLKYYPDPPKANWYRFRIAEGFVMDGQYDQARVELEELAGKQGIEELRERIAFLRAESFFLEGSSRDAIASFKTFLKHYPDSPLAGEMYFKLALSYESLGEIGNAYRAALKAKEHSPEKEIVDELLRRYEVEATKLGKEE